MYVMKTEKALMDTFIDNCTNEFALEAYRYNTEIDNWDNPVLVLVAENIVSGFLYYRNISKDVSQIINIYSSISGGGTFLLNYYNQNVGKDFTYLYMSDKALGFYKKFNLYPIKPELPSKEYQFCMYNTKSMIMEFNHNFISSKI